MVPVYRRTAMTPHFASSPTPKGFRSAAQGCPIFIGLPWVHNSPPTITNPERVALDAVRTVRRMPRRKHHETAADTSACFTNAKCSGTAAEPLQGSRAMIDDRQPRVGRKTGQPWAALRNAFSVCGSRRFVCCGPFLCPSRPLPFNIFDSQRASFFDALYTSARTIWKEWPKSGNYLLKTFFSTTFCARFLLSIFIFRRMMKLDADDMHH